MSPPEVIIRLQNIIKNIEPSYFTSNYSNTDELIGHIYRRHTDLVAIKDLEEKQHQIFHEKDIQYFTVDIDIRISNMERTLLSIYNYILKNDFIVNKKMYFLIAMCALEDILIQGQESSFSINVFGLESELKNSSYIVKDILDPLKKLFKSFDMEIVVIDMLVNHKELIEILNTKCERDGILLNWINKIPDRLLLDTEMEFKDIKDILHMSDVITYNLKLYEVN